MYILLRGAKIGEMQDKIKPHPHSNPFFEREPRSKGSEEVIDDFF